VLTRSLDRIPGGAVQRDDAHLSLRILVRLIQVKADPQTWP